MNLVAFLCPALLSGCAVSTTYMDEQPIAPVPGVVIYCETQSVHRECGYITKQQEQELRESMDDLAGKVGGF